MQLGLRLFSGGSLAVDDHRWLDCLPRGVRWNNLVYDQPCLWSWIACERLLIGDNAINFYTQRMPRILVGGMQLLICHWMQYHENFDRKYMIANYGAAKEQMYDTWSGIKPFRRHLRGTKSLKWVTLRGHAHFRDSLPSVGWDSRTCYVQTTYHI